MMWLKALRCRSTKKEGNRSRKLCSVMQLGKIVQSCVCIWKAIEYWGGLALCPDMLGCVKLPLLSLFPSCSSQKRQTESLSFHTCHRSQSSTTKIVYKLYYLSQILSKTQRKLHKQERMNRKLGFLEVLSFLLWGVTLLSSIFSQRPPEVSQVSKITFFLAAPYRGILRYPVSRDNFSASSPLPDTLQPFVALHFMYILLHIARGVCDTPRTQAQKKKTIRTL